MKAEQFDGIVENQIKNIKNVLAAKRKEYAPGDGDRLHNFRVAAALSNTSLAGAAMGMALKHIVSVADIVKLSEVGTVPSIEMIEEKFGDAINYLILIKACLVEQMEERPQTRPAGSVREEIEALFKEGCVYTDPPRLTPGVPCDRRFADSRLGDGAAKLITQSERV
jgi:hypothetical protein